MSTTKDALDIERIRIEIEEIRVKINKMVAETAKVNSENRWYPAIVGATVTLAIVAVTKLYL